MACPICFSPEGAVLTSGMRAGAMVLIVAATLIGIAIGRFAWRLWTLAAKSAERAEADNA